MLQNKCVIESKQLKWRHNGGGSDRLRFLTNITDVVTIYLNGSQRMLFCSIDWVQGLFLGFGRERVMSVSE